MVNDDINNDINVLYDHSCCGFRSEPVIIPQRKEYMT